MSSETPSGPPAGDRPSEPFTRGRIVWGRPPQQVFRVGPMPSGGTFPPSLGPASPRPTRSSGAGILTGSMVPPARAPEPVEPLVEPIVEALAPDPAPIAPPEPEPEPVAVEFERVTEPVAPAPAPQEIIIEPEASEPAITVPPPLSSEAKPAAKPRSLPSVVVTPAIYASVGAAIQKAAKGDRWLILAGVAAVAVIGGFIWLATLPAPRPVPAGPTPLVAAATSPVEEVAPAEPEVPAVVEQPRAAAPVAVAPAEPPVARPSGPASAPVRSSPSVVIAPSAPTAAAPRPYIETAPLVVEPPTPAAPIPSDPDAPVSTAPQPLN